MIKQHVISSTSALVLLWCQGRCYSSDTAKRYLDNLNLENGLFLHNECNKIWSHYNEVIINRKYAIFDLIKSSINQNKKLDQLIILGAGLAPLSLECKTQFENLNIFDIDIDNMEQKREIVSQMNEYGLNDIKFITADIEDAKNLEISLLQNGFIPDKPSIIIVEGISYYISAESLGKITSLFESADNTSRVIIDYLIPQKNILKERQFIPEHIFGLIQKQCNLPDIKKYNYNDFKNRFHAKLISIFTMKEIEKNRKHRNVYFPTNESGWIEIGLLGI